MNARRRLLACARPGLVAAGALLALTACEKPAPIVTVVSGGQSVYAQANTYCFEGQSVEAGDCATREEGATALEVRGGETVGIDVDKELAESGWFLELSDPATQGQQAQPQRSEPQTGHYFTFTAPNLPTGSTLTLTVRSLDDEGASTGEWRFTLSPKR